MSRFEVAPVRSRAAEEETLTALAIEGDRDAFAALYERYERRVYNVCYRILGSPEDAADATQEAFVNVLRRLPRLRGATCASARTSSRRLATRATTRSSGARPCS